MKMNSISGVKYHVKDLGKTKEFYDKLGFRIGEETPDSLTRYVNWFWVTFVVDPTESAADKGAGQFLYVKVDNVDEFYEGVLAKGMKPEGEPQKQPSGATEFTLRDPDGYNLVFFYKK